MPRGRGCTWKVPAPAAYRGRSCPRQTPASHGCAGGRRPIVAESASQLLRSAREVPSPLTDLAHITMLYVRRITSRTPARASLAVEWAIARPRRAAMAPASSPEPHGSCTARQHSSGAAAGSAQSEGLRALMADCCAASSWRRSPAYGALSFSTVQHRENLHRSRSPRCLNALLHVACCSAEAKKACCD